MIETTNHPSVGFTTLPLYGRVEGTHVGHFRSLALALKVLRFLF